MVNKKLHWVAIITLVLAIFSFAFGINSYLGVRDANTLSKQLNKVIFSKSRSKNLREVSVFGKITKLNRVWMHL